jgi:hypothetical protein
MLCARLELKEREELKKLKKFLATLVMAFSLTGMHVAAEGRATSASQPGAQEIGVFHGTLNPLVLQEGRRRRRRWRMNNNNNWNRRRWARRRWDNNGRHNGRWNRGRRGRGRSGMDH